MNSECFVRILRHNACGCVHKVSSEKHDQERWRQISERVPGLNFSKAQQGSKIVKYTLEILEAVLDPKLPCNIKSMESSVSPSEQINSTYASSDLRCPRGP